MPQRQDILSSTDDSVRSGFGRVAKAVVAFLVPTLTALLTHGHAVTPSDRAASFAPLEATMPQPDDHHTDRTPGPPPSPDRAVVTTSSGSAAAPLFIRPL